VNVVMISPAFPLEMREFTRGLAEVGANVIGLGDTPKELLPQEVKKYLSAYVRVPSLWDEESAVEEVKRDAARTRARVDRVECLWEPGMILAAKLREALGVQGRSLEKTIPFRDKEQMKRVLDAAGIRTPRHVEARTDDEVREAARRIGYPICVKPVAGAGSADTHRVDDDASLDRVLSRVRHVKTLSVEEFIEGTEYTFDTLSYGGKILFYNIGTYRPSALLGRQHEWISPQTLALRDPDAPHLAPGRAMGHAVLDALDFQTGFSHMEWFLTPKGEAVFGEIGCRPPGARSVDTMNYANDIDLFRGWAEVVVRGAFTQPVTRPYNSAIIFKRALGQGRIARIEGLEALLYNYGEHIPHVDLLPIGAPRRNWRQTLISDGWVVVRHPDLATTMELADKVGTDLRIHAA
jgi:hypothetical protein